MVECELQGCRMQEQPLQAGAFATFIQEIRLASRTIHIRNEVLYHKAEEEDAGT